MLWWIFCEYLFNCYRIFSLRTYFQVVFYQQLTTQVKKYGPVPAEKTLESNGTWKQYSRQKVSGFFFQWLPASFPFFPAENASKSTRKVRQKNLKIWPVMVRITRTLIMESIIRFLHCWRITFLISWKVNISTCHATLFKTLLFELHPDTAVF